MANDEYERIPIENALLYLLEDHQDAENGWEAGESTAVGNENDDAKYYALVEKHLDALLLKTSNGKIPVFEGRIQGTQSMTAECIKNASFSRQLLG